MLNTKDKHDTSLAMTHKNINVPLTINKTPDNVPPTVYVLPVIIASPGNPTSTLSIPQPPPAPPNKLPYPTIIEHIQS